MLALLLRRRRAAAPARARPGRAPAGCCSLRCSLAASAAVAQLALALPPSAARWRGGNGRPESRRQSRFWPRRSPGGSCRSISRNLPSATCSGRTRRSRRTNAALRGRLAGGCHELQQTKQRFELALSRSNITVFTQDADLRYTWLHNPRPGLTPETAGATWLESEPSDAPRHEARGAGDRAHRSGGVSVADGRGGASHFDLTSVRCRAPAAAIDGRALHRGGRDREAGCSTCASRRWPRRRRPPIAASSSRSRTRRSRVFEQDAALRYTFMHNPPPGTEPEDFLGRTDADLFGESRPAQARAAEAAGDRTTGARDAWRSSSRSAGRGGSTTSGSSRRSARRARSRG